MEEYMKTYLVTGGAGFIGANFIHSLFAKYDDNIFVINLDKLTYAGNLQNLSAIMDRRNYRFIQGDICDGVLVADIFKHYDIDYVINFAAESHVDRSIEDPGIFIKTNVLGTQILLDQAKRYWKNSEGYKKDTKFLQISTDEVYGSLGEEGYFSEDTPLDPHSPYSASKASADLLVKAYYDTYKMPVNITRCSNNYGPYQHPEKLIPLTINNCLKGRAIPVYGDGENIRDWLYVKDHCKAIDLVLNQGRLGEFYNIGGHNEKMNIDIVKLLISLMKDLCPALQMKNYINEDLIEFVHDRKGHDRRYAIDATKIERDLGWRPDTRFGEGIYQTIKWYLDHQEWLKDIISDEYENYYEQMYLKDRL